MLNRSKILFHHLQDFALSSSAQYLSKQVPAGPQHHLREFIGRFGKCHDLYVISLAMTGRVSRHVREHRVGLFTAERIDNHLRGIRLQKVLVE